MITEKIKSMNWKDRIFWGVAALLLLGLMVIGLLQWDVNRSAARTAADLAAWEQDFFAGRGGTDGPEK